MDVRGYRWVAIASVAAAFGLLSLAVARDDPAWSLAGRSTLAGIAELGAGWSLVAAGLLFWSGHRGNRFGPLLVAAGFAWFLPEWSNPGVGTAIGFTVGLAGLVACTPFVGHAALVYPTGRLRSRLDVAVVAVSYVGALLVLGLLPATVFDPTAAGCLQCPRNLVETRGDADLFETFNRYGLWIGIGWLSALGALLVWRLVRSPRAVAAIRLPVLVPAIAYLALVALDIGHSLARGILSNDPFDQRIWRSEAAALVAVALGVGWALLKERRARSSVARFVVELGQSPRPGAVRVALAETLGDPALELVYSRPENGGYVDAAGRPADIGPGPDRAVTPLLRGQTVLAALVHDKRLLDQPGLLEEVLTAARVAVENEQLQAEVRAQIEDLRVSRARIVSTGDAERRRLERDLHDGAQQSLLALSYDLRLARAAAEAESESDVATLLESAVGEAQTALGELRELAHGIYPAILAEAGLTPALATLGDEAPLPVELRVMTQERYGAPAETAAYLAVAAMIDEAAERGATFVTVGVGREGERLVVTIRHDGADRSSELIKVADRVGSLGGTLELGRGSLRAVIPCA
jgi:signal transduction histidine kinase